MPGLRAEVPATFESEYVLGGHVHVKHFVFACVAVSSACALISIAFLDGYFKIIGIVVPPALHLLLAFAVHTRHVTALYAFFGLILTLYFVGILSILIILTMEVVQSHRGSFKLYLIHSASLSGLWTNILLLLMYGLHKWIKVIRNSNTYANLINEGP